MAAAVVRGHRLTGLDRWDLWHRLTRPGQNCAQPDAVRAFSPAPGNSPAAKVLVKRLVCIEDLGDVEVLFTDKAGTLTEGRISFMWSVGDLGTADCHRHPAGP